MRILIFVIGVIVVSTGAAAEFELNGHNFMVPDGFEVEQIAGPPLVERPVSVDFDERGRLYVTDSSGSNEERDGAEFSGTGTQTGSFTSGNEFSDVSQR